MLKLSGFADEISQDLDTQIRVMQASGVSHFELRSIADQNVLQFTDAQCRDYRGRIEAAGLKVLCIASPCGKQPIDMPEEELLAKFKRARDIAGLFDASMIRVFSYYPPGGEGKGPVEPMADRVVELLGKQADLLEGHRAIMVHENEKGIFGDTAARCEFLLSQLDSPKLGLAFDFANFIQVGEDPQAIWPRLRPYVDHIHIKDAKKDGTIVPAGEGSGGIGPILADAWANDYRGYLAMEPHLKVAGHSHGETGPDLWHVAVDSLRALCEKHGVPLQPENWPQMNTDSHR